MNIIISSLNTCTVEDLLPYKEFLEFLKKDGEKDLEVINFILDYKSSYGIFPDIDKLLKNFPFLEKTYPSDDISTYIKNLIADEREMALRRELLSISSDTVLTVDKIENLKKFFSGGSSENIKFHSEFDGMNMYESLKNRPPGMKFYIEELDKEVSGISYGTLTTLFGYVGHGKSTLATSIAYKNAIDGYNLAFITLEVSKEEVYWNFISRHALSLFPNTQITAKRIKKAYLSEHEEQQLKDIIIPSFNNIKGKIFILDAYDIGSENYGCTEDTFKRVLERCNDKCSGHLDAFFVDYVNMMKFFKSMSASEFGVDAFVAFTNSLVTTFGDKGLIGVLCAQANREGYKQAVRRGGKYTLTALAEFNQIERASWRVIPLYYGDELRESRELSLQIIKNRDGSLIEEPIRVPINPVNFKVEDEEGYSEVYNDRVFDDADFYGSMEGDYNE